MAKKCENTPAGDDIDRQRNADRDSGRSETLGGAQSLRGDASNRTASPPNDAADAPGQSSTEARPDRG